MAVRKIISGGQTGADQGGLEAGRKLGLVTGGWAPRGWRTETGAAQTLLGNFGLREHAQASYPARTRANVLAADATVVFGSLLSPGSKLTWTECVRQQRPRFHVQYPQASPSADVRRLFRLWLQATGAQTLNIAGNRESRAPGIQAFTREFLLDALKEAA